MANAATHVSESKINASNRPRFDHPPTPYHHFYPLSALYHWSEMYRVILKLIPTLTVLLSSLLQMDATKLIRLMGSALRNASKRHQAGLPKVNTNDLRSS